MTPVLMLLLPTLAAAGCLSVAANRITAGDVSRAVPAFAAAPPEDMLGYTPAPGARRVFSGEDLRRWARRYALSETPLPPSLCVEWTAAPLTEAALLKALRTAVASGEARIEVRDYSRQNVPPGELEFPRSGLHVPPRWQQGEPLLWRGRVKYAAGRSAPVWARVSVSIPGRRVVARRNLLAGEAIAREDLKLEMCERRPFQAPALDALEQAAGRIPRRAIAAGQELTAPLLHVPFVVAKGDRVAVEVHSGSMKLTMEAISESPGRVGDKLLLRNPVTGKRFPVRIEGKGRAVAARPEA